MHWKKILGITAIAAIIIILSVIGFISTYDFNRLKPRIREIVRTHTGREIHLNDDIKLGIGLSPSLKVQSATFQNAPWGSRPNLARIKQLDVQVELLPLLQGRVRVKRLVLIEPDILVELDTAGRSNLEFDLPAPSEKPSSGPAPQSKRGSTVDILAIKQARLENAKLAVRDHRTDKTTTLEIENSHCRPRVTANRST